MKLEEFRRAWQAIEPEIAAAETADGATKVAREKLVPAVRATLFGDNTAPFSDPDVQLALETLRYCGGSLLRDAMTMPDEL